MPDMENSAAEAAKSESSIRPEPSAPAGADSFANGKAAFRIETELEGQKTLKKVEEMIDMAYEIIPHWPAVFRYSRGERIMNLLHEMEELCIAGHLKYFNKTTLRDLDIKNHQLRLAIRGARRKSYTDKAGHRKTLLQPGGYEKWAQLSLDAGGMIGSWIASVKDKKKTDD